MMRQSRLVVPLLFLLGIVVVNVQALSWMPPSSCKPLGVVDMADTGDVSTTTATTTSTTTSRRDWLVAQTTMSLATWSCLPLATRAVTTSTTSTDDDSSSMYSPKFVQQYQDFTETPAGWSYRDVKIGGGKNTENSSDKNYQAQVGDRVVFDWSGYTVGYFGRPFQAKGGPQGGAFDKDVDYERTVLGSGKMIPALEQALVGMSTGGIRQVLVPYTANLSYPPSDPEHNVVGPKPTTFSGMRALNFVLENPRVDRTLLFNVKVIRIDRPDGRGGFKRGV